MIVAIDTTTAPAGDVAARTLDLIAALARPTSPASALVLLGREEHRQSLREATFGLSTVLTLDPPEAGRHQMDDYRKRKLSLLAQHGAQLLHVAGGGPLDLLSVGLPVVLSVDDLRHRTTPADFTAPERWHRETWWTASAHRADTLVVPTEGVRAVLRGELGLDPAKVFVAPGGTLLPGLAAAYGRAVGGNSVRKAA